MLKALFGRRLRQLRHARGLTQEELAHAVNISARHLRDIEHGVHWPSAGLIEQFMAVFKVKATVFFEEEPNQHQNKPS